MKCRLEDNYDNAGATADKRLRITFIIPSLGVTGGIKVVFHYANELVKRGHDVRVVAPRKLKVRNGLGWTLECGLLKLREFIRRGILGSRKERWFPLDPRVKVSVPPRADARYIPDGDVVFATANQTADWVVDYPPDRGEKFYLIQHYETWTRDHDKVDRTWKMPLRKIVVASWLADLARDRFCEEVAAVILSGIDAGQFDCPDRIFDTCKRVLMVYSEIPSKGIEDGLKAFRLAAEQYPHLQLVMFGMDRQPDLDFPFEYYYRPQQETICDIYASCDVLLWPSLVEGCGLPPMEAMACKCAVVATCTGGIPDYAVPGKTALVVSPGQPEMLARELMSLVEDREKMKAIALAGYEHIRQFTWDASAVHMESVLKRELENSRAKGCR